MIHPHIAAWMRAGKPIPPPPIFKQKLVRRYAAAYAIDTLVETGTGRGDMVDANKDFFQEIFTIELHPLLFDTAQQRFSAHGQIHVLFGDSGERISDVLSTIQKPCLFWLDAHYAWGDSTPEKKDTPIREELNPILNHNRSHILLIDDARYFTGKRHFPTLDELYALITNVWGPSKFVVKDDIIRVHR